MYLEEQSKVKQLEMELKSTKDIVSNLKEMLRGSKQTEIKKEPQVAIPNRPSSNGGTQGKKRKKASNKIQQDDVSILNPQLYKTYCSLSDPEKAREAIRKMEYCLRVTTLRAVDDINRNVREVVKDAVKSYIFDYWGDSDNLVIEHLKPVIDDYVRWYEEEHRTDLVLVNMLTTTGIEIWVVEDFDKGPKESKWFRKIFKLMPILS